jgi:hypothetical protein
MIGPSVGDIQPHHQLPGVDELIVRHRNFGDEPRYVWRDRRDVAADIGIIGTLEKTIDRPPVASPSCSTRTISATGEFPPLRRRPPRDLRLKWWPFWGRVFAEPIECISPEAPNTTSMVNQSLN